MTHALIRQILIFFLVSAIIGTATWMIPISFDDAFNYQVASSLAKTFTYQTSYIPSKIYHDQITTNGPIQYFMAFLIGSFGLDIGRTIGLGLIGGLAALSAYNFSRNAFIMYFAMLLFWPLFAWTHTYFWGEIFSIAMIMLGLTWWNQCPTPSSFNKFGINRWLDHRLYFAGIAFGIAIATKLLTIALIPIIIFCLFFYRCSGIADHTPGTRSILFFYWVIIPFGIALIVFFIQFSFSVIHSTGTVTTIFPLLKQFILSHFNQANKTAESRHTIMQVLKLVCGPLKSGSGIAIILLISSLVILVRKHLSFYLLAGVILLFLFIFHLNPRRMLPFTVITILLSVAVNEYKSFTTNSTTNVQLHPTLLYLLVVLIIGNIFIGAPILLWQQITKFSPTGTPPNIAYVSTTQNRYDAKLISIIKKLPGPIFTSGWWQFPEISLRTGTVFHDKFDRKIFSSTTSQKHKFILFSSANTIDNLTETIDCGKILFRDGSLVLCEYK